MVEPPASLGAVPLGWDSNAGRGIFEAGLLLKAGTAPRPWPRLGVPLIVPLDAMVSKYPGVGRREGRGMGVGMLSADITSDCRSAG